MSEVRASALYSIWPIQASLFALYGSATCIAPYISVYLDHYTIANKRDVGSIESISSVTNIFLRLTLGYIADRYQLHRLIYLICTLLYLVVSTSLLGPIFLANHGNTTSQIETNLAASTTTITSATTTIAPRIVNLIDDDEEVNHYRLQPYNSLGDLGIAHVVDKGTYPTDDELTSTQAEPQEWSLEAIQWFYLVAIMVIITELMMKVNMNFGDAFCADSALKVDSSYSAIRFWGGLGRTLGAFTMIFVNQIKPLLAPALILSSLLTIFNVIVILISRGKNSNFNLSSEASIDNNSNEIDATEEMEKEFAKIKFGYNMNFRKRKLSSCMGDMQILELEDLSNKNKFKSSVKIKRLNVANKFDTREEDKFRNIRRCSLAPLGDSFVIKQFELDNKNVKHFNHVTKIEPVANISNVDPNKKNNLQLPLPEFPKQLWPTSAESGSSSSKLAGEGADDEDIYSNKMIASDPIANNDGDPIGFMIYLRVMVMIGIKNKQLIRFMALYAFNGLVAAIGWVYLFPYLEAVDEPKFASLSGFLLMSRYLSETVFYYISPQNSLFNSINHATSLSIILFFYALRYLLYINLGSRLPIEMVVLIEMLRAPTMGWYNCVSNEAALKFALESNKCVPDLIASGHIENNPQTIKRLNSGFKATMVIISACFFDGFGFAIGSYLGGHIVQAYGFIFLWFSTSLLAIIVSLLNLTLEIFIKRRRQKSSSASVSLNEKV